MTTPTDLTIQVKGMTCGHCVRAVTQAIQEQDKQATVEIDLATGNTVVRSTLTRDAVVAAITDEGYQVLG
jgi:copper chaperone